MALSNVQWAKVKKDLARIERGVSPAGIYSFMEHGLHWLLQALSSENIDLQSGPSSMRWAPLKESTQRVRRGMPGIQPDKPINVRTRNLQNYLWTAPASYYPAPDGGMMVFPGDAQRSGTRLMYAYHTAQGGSSRWGTPARPVVGIGPTEIGILHQTTQIYIHELFGMDYGQGNPWVGT